MNISRSAPRSLNFFKRSNISQRIATRALLIEEGTLKHYDPELYYPVRINELFHHRYRTCVKLGYGGYSTVWLCRDEADCSYKALKIGTCNKDGPMTKELRVLDYLKSLNSVHDGQSCVRRACDTFQIDVLAALTHVWYIKLDNIQEVLPDDSTEILTSLVDAERKEPGPQKIVDERVTIYTSRSLDYKEDLVFPILGDLGMAVFGETEYSHIIQPIPYRAPEVILGMKWNESVDIWNFGVIVWELLCGEHLFGKDNEQDSLAKMVKYLGPPPIGFLERSYVHLQYFDERGNWKGTPLESTALKDRLEGAGDIDLFIDFVRPMLSWEPEKRPTAAALLTHPWLQS